MTPESLLSPKLEVKIDLTKKYAQALEEIWKKVIDEGPELGNPLHLFDEALRRTEVALAGILKP